MVGRILTFRKRFQLTNKSIARFCNTISNSGSRFLIRQAIAKDMDFATQQGVREKRNIGPNDFPNAFTLDGRGLFVGEVDNKLVGHIAVIKYPNSHSHIASCILEPEHRRKGYGTLLYNTCYDYCDKCHTIGSDVRISTKSEDWIEGSGGFEAYWRTSVTMLSAYTVAQKLARNVLPFHVSIKPISNLSSLLEYDTVIFGTPRHALIKGWLNTSGSLGMVAVKDSSIVGYTILRQVIRGGGTEVGMAMAPLYADNVHIAKALMKTAAEKCLASEAVPNTKMSLYYPDGKNCAEGSSELMEELEAEHNHFAYRMYSKGVPPGRKLNKIYGIASPMFD